MMMNQEQANRIAEACLEKFERLPKTGKPNLEFEWTILSAIVLVDGGSEIEIVSMGTGTKCLGSDELSEKGDVLNDSHAEVMARRGFLRYLMQQMNNSLINQTSALIYNNATNKFVLKEGVSFHFFTTHSPCGDASIYEQSDLKQEPTAKRMKCESSEAGQILNTADGMTGGKLLSCTSNDLMAQDLGMIRTKPGKGVRTLSVSCSDKMIRWNILGVQGSLLMMLLEQPIYLRSIVFCDGTDYNKEAVERALWKRWNTELIHSVLLSPYSLNQSGIFQATNGLLFDYRKNRKVKFEGKFKPYPGGIVWCSGVNKELEVEISGRRQGVTKKKLGTPAARLKISKIELFSTFVGIQNKLLEVARTRGPAEVIKGTGTNSEEHQVWDSHLRYCEAKNRSHLYREQWKALRVKVFETWTEKPNNLLDFSLG
ncbi:tRNA-specific adenosine deaminase 1 [Toxorhynchites rutilus septentrionalis]|uniref:tRNA-specific adenosine deaminase 1 n=1 Tax=Toxorhynchites rutilus septentrionalis TaxID=329112 RepID=UPI0024796DB9|nr:tRNA-specific adenosine deaminase 1 [Toxorhynchites rutilus septentrionalis]